MEIYESNGRFRDLAALLEELAERTEEMPVRQRLLVKRARVLADHLGQPAEAAEPATYVIVESESGTATEYDGEPIIVVKEPDPVAGDVQRPDGGGLGSSAGRDARERRVQGGEELAGAGSHDLAAASRDRKSVV